MKNSESRKAQNIQHNITLAERSDSDGLKVVLPGIVEPEGFYIEKFRLPAPADGEVLIKVEATGISFAEQSMRRGRYPAQPSFPFVPGYDLVGTVTACGAGVDRDLVGKRVAALTKTGGWATHVIIEASKLLDVPDHIDASDAEALIVNGITAWQMLFREAKVERGDTILLHGANGGVGTILAQLAIHAGIRGIGTASARHHKILREQGIEPVDYHDVDWDSNVRRIAPDGVKAAFDNVGGESAEKSFRLLKKGGILICSAIASELNSKRSLWLPFIHLILKVVLWKILPNGKDATFYDIWAGKSKKNFMINIGDDYKSLLKLVAEGNLRPRIAARYALTEIVAAMKFAESRTAYGKVVLLP